MTAIKIPENVENILKSLQKKGYKAYIVGGCVRDALMDKEPQDWDICTNALPHRIIDIFKDSKVITNGIKHGTVGIISNGCVYEITAFRTEGAYLDNRHPENVSFVSDIKEDLKRRDFTVNAMAYNKDEGLKDYFCGINDLENKIIRCVGNPDKRFSEDALRIMRAIRFSAVLGFSVDEETKKSIIKNSALLENISKERINSEFCKILLSKNPEVLYEYEEVFKRVCRFKTIKTDFDLLRNTESVLYMRLCTFILLSEFENGYKTDFLENMRFDGKTIKKVISIVDNFKISLENDITKIRLLIKDMGYDRVYDIIKLKNLFEGGKYNDVCETYKKIISEGLCQRLSELDINGNDLIKNGICFGSKTGEVLNKLLEDVIINNTENKKEVLLKRAILQKGKS